MKIVRESKTEYRITPKMKIVRESKSEYRILPPNENCQRVQIHEFQNTPPPKMGKTSDFQLQNSLKMREIYVETNLYPPGYHSLMFCTVSKIYVRWIKACCPMQPSSLEMLQPKLLSKVSKYNGDSSQTAALLFYFMSQISVTSPEWSSWPSKRGIRRVIGSTVRNWYVNREWTFLFIIRLGQLWFNIILAFVQISLRLFWKTNPYIVCLVFLSLE